MSAWGIKARADHHFDYVLPDGFRVNLSHHGPSVSKRVHLREGGARRYLDDQIQDAVNFGETVPNLYQRGHVHVPVSTNVTKQLGLEEHKAHIIITPPLTGPNQYARKFTKSGERTVCGVYFSEVIDGKLGEVIPFLRKRKNTTTVLMPEGMPFYNSLIEKKEQKKNGLFRKMNK